MEESNQWVLTAVMIQGGSGQNIHYPFFVRERSPFVGLVLPHVAICLKDEHKNRAERSKANREEERERKESDGVRTLCVCASACGERER